MGKSASSSKKTKRSKDSSKLRSVKKKKTKRNKSKKIRRIKDYSDESESGFSGSDSSLYSSSSEDDYRREKRRSKVSKKKRSRKRYSSSDDDDDDDGIRLLKKKKSSKRKDEHVGTKKKKKRTVSRKRRKRDSSSSYTSSDSYSIRDDQSNDGSESDGKRRARDRGRLSEFNDARIRSKDGLEEESEPDECLQVEDEVMTAKNSRRLKSIVVVSYNYGNDERNEDMGGDHDDASDENKIVDERDGEARISYPRTGADKNGRETFGYDEFEEDIRSETSKVSYADNSLKDDDLEAILKKRALENLKRFRGETQKNGISSKEVSSVSEGEETLQIESGKVEESQDDGLMEQKLCDSAEGKDLETSQKSLQVVNVKESGIGLADLASQQGQQPGESAKVKSFSGISSCTTKRKKLIRPVLGQESLSLASRREAVGCQDAEAESINDSTIDKNCPESSLALATKNGGDNIEPTKVSSTSSSHAETEPLDEIKGESQSEQKTIDETKDESQYEKKTMNVMRGGELVKVSYKVYIPKKTSLGRRQLRR